MIEIDQGFLMHHSILHKIPVEQSNSHSSKDQSSIMIHVPVEPGTSTLSASACSSSNNPSPRLFFLVLSVPRSIEASPFSPLCACLDRSTPWLRLRRIAASLTGLLARKAICVCACVYVMYECVCEYLYVSTYECI